MENKHKKFAFLVCIGLCMVVGLFALGTLLTNDLTYNDVEKFLEKDNTDQILYKNSEFVCWDFAERLQAEAKKAGLECAVVTLTWSGSYRSHVINAFKTADRGLIWVDVTGSHSENIRGYDRIEVPKEAGNMYLYEEIGGLPPMQVVLETVTYDW